MFKRIQYTNKRNMTKTIMRKIAIVILTMWGLSASIASAAEWKLGHVLPPDHPANRALEAVAKEIAKRTDNRINIKIFPAGQIGGAKEILVGMTVGTHQMAFDGAGILSQWEKRLSIFEAPYLATDFAHLERLIQSPTGQEILTSLLKNHGLRMLNPWYYGTRHLTNNQRPIYSIDDLKGLKIRVPEVALSLKFATALGMKPTPMAFSEVYLGLQTGIVDGQENPLPTIKAAKFFEVQKYLALTGHLVQFVAPIVAESTWQAASPEDRAIVMETFERIGASYNNSVATFEKTLIKELEAAGMQITVPDQKKLAVSMKPLYADFSNIWGPKTYETLSRVK